MADNARKIKPTQCHYLPAPGKSNSLALLQSKTLTVSVEQVVAFDKGLVEVVLAPAVEAPASAPALPAQ